MPTHNWTNSVSRLFGKFANVRFPEPIQRLINTTYVSAMEVDLRDFNPVESYDTLNALFTRKLAQDKHFDENANVFISPVDARITAQGKLKEDTLMQIKGMDYSVQDLLTDNAGYIDHVLNGDFITFYLSPTDYHRYHAPTTSHLKKLIHVPGTLYAVNEPSAKTRTNLFVQNERVILECEHPTGNMFYLVFVGALNVGNMVFEFEPRVETNTKSTSVKVYEYDHNKINKGEDLGCFKMGSSVVLVSQKDFLELKTTVNQKVKFGDVVAQVKN
jgi:phosphatidylserine decarboxylase